VNRRIGGREVGNLSLGEIGTITVIRLSKFLDLSLVKKVLKEQVIPSQKARMNIPTHLSSELKNSSLGGAGTKRKPGGGALG